MGVTANEVDTALAAETNQTGILLAAITEDQWFERKSVRIAPQDMAKPLTALANAEGGVSSSGCTPAKSKESEHSPTR
jgi:ATP-dependent DNA helicase RecG